MGIISNFLRLNRYTILARIAIILLILPLHEFAHGWMANKCGDDTAKKSGRLTLNPIAHIDPFGAVLLVLTGFGWAKPVPINPRLMRHPRSGVIWTSLAGPVSNLLAALVGVIGLQIVYPFLYTSDSAVLMAIYYFFSSFASVNIGLAIFNLIPVPPLDGSKVLMNLLPYRGAMWMGMHAQILSIILLFLVLFGALSMPLSYLASWILEFMVWCTNWIRSLSWQLV